MPSSWAILGAGLVGAQPQLDGLALEGFVVVAGRRGGGDGLRGDGGSAAFAMGSYAPQGVHRTGSTPQEKMSPFHLS